MSSSLRVDSLSLWRGHLLIRSLESACGQDRFGILAAENRRYTRGSYQIIAADLN